MPTPIEEIKSRIDVVDLINEYVKLTPGGANWKARCPFHNEKSPSFMVSRSKGIWHCFGCGKGGDIFAFLQEMEGLEFVEALRVLAKRANVTLAARDPQLASRRNLLLDIMRAAVEAAHASLRKSEKARAARAYLAERGVEEETVELFKLGYTPNEWETMKTHLKEQGFKEDDILAAGLLVRSEKGSTYDRFRGRILFPIHDLHGNPIGFGGRIIESGIANNEFGPTADSRPPEAASAKYINTPQSLVYDKSAVLFGIDRAKQDIRREGAAVVVEGYMDCLTSHQAGVRHVVASSGTALTEQHVRLLKRYADTVILAFDADAAGQEAAKRGVGQALAQELTVKILELPMGKDPDELIRQDVDAWRKAIAAAQPALAYFVASTLARLDVNKVEDKKRAVKELLPLIAMARDPVEQSHYLKQLAGAVGVAEHMLREKLPGQGKQGVGHRALGVGEKEQTEAVILEQSREERLSDLLVALLVKYPDELAYVAEQLSPQAVTPDVNRKLYTEAIVWYTEHHAFELEAFRTAHADDAELLERMDVAALLAEREFPEENGISVRRELAATIPPLKRSLIRQKLATVTKRIEELEHAGPPDELEAATQAFHELTDELRQLG